MSRRVRTGLRLAWPALLLSAATLPAAAQSAACAASFTAAPTIQGRGAATALAGATVTVQGIVVGDFEGPSPALRGFYLQDEQGDGAAQHQRQGQQKAPPDRQGPRVIARAGALHVSHGGAWAGRCRMNLAPASAWGLLG